MIQLPSPAMIWDKYKWWILAVLLVACIAIILSVRGCIRKENEQKEAQEQAHLDSLSIRAGYLEKKAAKDSTELATLKTEAQIIGAALQTTSTERKKEDHAYTQNITAVRELPADKQLDFFASWLSEDAAARQ